MRVLVTGHHGYIGSVTVPELRRAGFDVTGLDTLYYEGCDLEADDGGPPLLRCDVRDVGLEHLAGFEAVVHLAALSNDPIGDLRPELTRAINLDGTMHLARTAKEAGVALFVFASSCSMYGAAEDGAPADEYAPLRPLSAYAESKARAEEGLSELASDAFSPVYMRNATAYGISPRLRVDVVLNNLVGWAFTTGKVRILSDGTPWRPLVHVRDIARATVAVLQAPREVVHDQAVNVGGDRENYRVRELAEIAREAVGGCELEFAGRGDPDPRSYRVNFAKLRRMFPTFELEWTAERGAAELVEAYSRVGLTLSEFEGDRYTRLARLKRLFETGALDDSLRWEEEPTL